MKYYERIDNYIRISNDLFREFEKAFKKNQECELVYVNNKKNKVSIKSKILKFLNIDGAEFMDIEEGTRIRLDKIVFFNGEDTKYLNHY